MWWRQEEGGGVEGTDPQKLISLKGRRGKERRGDSKGLCVYDHKWREQTPAVTCLCQPYSQLLCECVLCACMCVAVWSQLGWFQLRGKLWPRVTKGKGATEKGVCEKGSGQLRDLESERSLFFHSITLKLASQCHDLPFFWGALVLLPLGPAPPLLHYLFAPAVPLCPLQLEVWWSSGSPVGKCSSQGSLGASWCAWWSVSSALDFLPGNLLPWWRTPAPPLARPPVPLTPHLHWWHR